MDELLKCPFCGCELEPYSDSEGYEVICDGVPTMWHPLVGDCLLDGFRVSIDGRREWNRRAHDARVELLRKELADGHKIIRDLTDENVRLRRAPDAAGKPAEGETEDATPTPDPAVMRDYIDRLTRFFIDRPEWVALSEEARSYVALMPDREKPAEDVWAIAAELVQNMAWAYGTYVKNEDGGWSIYQAGLTALRTGNPDAMRAALAKLKETKDG